MPHLHQLHRMNMNPHQVHLRKYHKNHLPPLKLHQSCFRFRMIRCRRKGPKSLSQTRKLKHIFSWLIFSFYSNFIIALPCFQHFLFPHNFPSGREDLTEAEFYAKYASKVITDNKYSAEEFAQLLDKYAATIQNEALKTTY